MAYVNKVGACNKVLSKKLYQENKIQFNNWVKITEKACLKNFENILSPWYGYSFVAGRAILEHLRKPTYWGDEYIGLWQAYTPETGIDENEVAARAVCNRLANNNLL